jgi:hypothetical protein
MSRITPELLFDIYQQEHAAVVAQVREKEGDRLPAVLKLIEAKRNERVVIERVRAGIRWGLVGLVESALHATRRDKVTNPSR